MPTANEMQRFKVGKVPPSTLLRAVYPYLGRKSRSLLIGPGIGRDATAIRYGNKVLVFSTDPITGTATHIGRHSVHINANDIATVGARPIWYLCTILLPPDADEISLRQIMVDVDNAAKGLGIAVVGGHTEVTPGLTRPIIAGFMIGETTKQGLLSSEGGREGDKVLLTKTAGLEGTAILATDYGNKLKDLEPKTLDRARKFSEQISVVKEALTAARVKGVHAMHDPTEGGVLNVEQTGGAGAHRGSVDDHAGAGHSAVALPDRNGQPHVEVGIGGRAEDPHLARRREHSVLVGHPDLDPVLTHQVAATTAAGARQTGGGAARVLPGLEGVVGPGDRVGFAGMGCGGG